MIRTDGVSTMPTYLLVHGAWHSGQAWARVVPLLGMAGHRVLAPSLTGYGERAHLLSPEVGLDTHVDDIVRLIVEEDLHEGILVGHSYAGLVISGAANQVPDRIAQLVYLDAMVPEDGETAVDAQPVSQIMIDQAAQSGHGWRVPPLPQLPPPAGRFAGARAAGPRRVDPAAPPVAATGGTVRRHRPGRSRLAAHDAVRSTGALPAAAGPDGTPGPGSPPPD